MSTGTRQSSLASLKSCNYTEFMNSCIDYNLVVLQEAHWQPEPHLQEAPQHEFAGFFVAEAVVWFGPHMMMEKLGGDRIYNYGLIDKTDSLA